MFKIDKNTLKKKLKVAYNITQEQLDALRTKYDIPPEWTVEEIGKLKNDDDFLSMLSAFRRPAPPPPRNEPVKIDKHFPGLSSSIKRTLFREISTKHFEINKQILGEAGKQIQDMLMESAPPPFINLVVGEEDRHCVEAFLTTILEKPFEDSKASFLYRPHSQKTYGDIQKHLYEPVAFTADHLGQDEITSLQKILFGTEAGSRLGTQKFKDLLAKASISEKIFDQHILSRSTFSHHDSAAAQLKLENYSAFIAARMLAITLPDGITDQHLYDEFDERLIKNNQDLNKFKNDIEKILKICFSPLWFKYIPAEVGGPENATWPEPHFNLGEIQTRLCRAWGYPDPVMLFGPLEDIPNPIENLPEVGPLPTGQQQQSRGAGTPAPSPVDEIFGQPSEPEVSSGLDGIEILGKIAVMAGNEQREYPIYQATKAETAINYGRHLVPYLKEFFITATKSRKSAMDLAALISCNLIDVGFFNDKSTRDYVIKRKGKDGKEKDVRIIKCLPIDLRSAFASPDMESDPTECAINQTVLGLLQTVKEVSQEERQFGEINPEDIREDDTPLGIIRTVDPSLRRTVLLITKKPITTEGPYKKFLDQRYIVRLDLINKKTIKKFLFSEFFAEKNFALAFKDLRTKQITYTRKSDWENIEKGDEGFKDQIFKINELVDSAMGFTSLWDFTQAFGLAFNDQDNNKVWMDASILKDGQPTGKTKRVLNIRGFSDFMRNNAMLKASTSSIRADDQNGMIRIASPLVYRSAQRDAKDKDFLSEEFMSVMSEMEYMPTSQVVRDRLKRIEKTALYNDQIKSIFGDIESGAIKDADVFIEKLKTMLDKLNSQSNITDGKNLTLFDITGEDDEGIIKKNFTNDKDRFLKDLKDKLSALFDRIIIVYGPPGTGKTDFGKVLTWVLGEQYRVMFLDVVGQRGSGLVGDTERITREFFDIIRRGNKTIFIVDEAETVIPAERGQPGGLHESTQSTLSQWKTFLADEFTKSGLGERNDVYLVMTTNYYSRIDTAVHRRAAPLLISYEFELTGIQFLTMKSVMKSISSTAISEGDVSNALYIFGIGEKSKIEDIIKDKTNKLKQTNPKITDAQLNSEIAKIRDMVTKEIEGTESSYKLRRIAVRSLSWAFFQEAHERPSRPYSNAEIVEFVDEWNKGTAEKTKPWTSYLTEIIASIHNTHAEDRAARWQSIVENPYGELAAGGGTAGGYKPLINTNLTPDSNTTAIESAIPKTYEEARRIENTNRGNPNLAYQPESQAEVGQRAQPTPATPAVPPGGIKGLVGEEAAEGMPTAQQIADKSEGNVGSEPGEPEELDTRPHGKRKSSEQRMEHLEVKSSTDIYFDAIKHLVK